VVEDPLLPVALSLLPYFLALIAPLAFLGLPRFSRRCASVIDCVSSHRGRTSRRREEFTYPFPYERMVNANYRACKYSVVA